MKNQTKWWDLHHSRRRDESSPLTFLLRGTHVSPVHLIPLVSIWLVNKLWKKDANLSKEIPTKKQHLKNLHQPIPLYLVYESRPRVAKGFHHSWSFNTCLKVKYNTINTCFFLVRLTTAGGWWSSSSLTSYNK